MTWKFVSHSRLLKKSFLCVLVEPRASWVLAKTTAPEPHPQPQATSSLGCMTNSSVFLAGDTEHTDPFVMLQAPLWPSLAYWAEQQGLFSTSEAWKTPYLYVKGHHSCRSDVSLCVDFLLRSSPKDPLSSLSLYTACNQIGWESGERSG